ncbi:MAG: SH3 domain-containing protein [Nevskia sp.]|uniref:SH3 domain-containing protein n=1 Tax=Nevskia sp. TaxID=1929292 RepID=UPI0040352DC6
MPAQPVSSSASSALRALAGLIAASLAIPAAFAAEQATAALAINLRAAPDLGSTITGVLKPGEVVEVLESVGEFVRVRRVSGTTGHLKRKYLRLPASADVPPATVTAMAKESPPPAASREPLPAVTETAPAMAVETSLGSPVATAPATASASTRRVYVRAMAGAGFAGKSAGRIERALDTAGGDVLLRKLDTVVPAYELAAGYALTSRFAFEAGLMQLGDYRGRVEAAGADAARLQSVLDDNIPRGGWGAEVQAVAEQPIGAWRLGAGAGMFCAFEDAPLRTNVPGVSVDSRPCAPLLNLRLGRVLTPHWTLGLASHAAFFDSRVMSVGLSLQYR